MNILRAVETYGLSYEQLKRMARASLEHSFIPGASLWSDGRAVHRAEACEEAKSSGENPPQKCGKFLDANERAHVQWELEKAFAEFEKKF